MRTLLIRTPHDFIDQGSGADRVLASQAVDKARQWAKQVGGGCVTGDDWRAREYVVELTVPDGTPLPSWLLAMLPKELPSE
jgi:hypothetical protein